MTTSLAKLDPMHGALALLGLGRTGFGQTRGSTFTVAAANALDDALVTNGCAGCSDLAGRLRQLTFAFKAAALTDTAVQDSLPQPLNMSSPLAMTAFGPGTNKALSYVLGPSRSYDGGPCTDESGNCLGFTIWQPPPTAQPIIDQLMTAVRGALTMFAQSGQNEALWTQLQTLVRHGLAQLSAIIPQPQPTMPQPAPQPAPQPPKPQIEPPPPPTPSPTLPEKPPTPPAKKEVPWITYGLIGTGLAAVGMLVYFLAAGRINSGSGARENPARRRKRRRRRRAGEAEGKVLRSRRYGTFTTGSKTRGKRPRGRGPGSTVATFSGEG